MTCTANTLQTAVFISSGLASSFRNLSLFHRYILYLEEKGFKNPKLKKIRCPSSLVKKDIVKDYGVPEEKLAVIPNAADWHKIGKVFDKRQTTAAERIHHHQLDAQRACLLFLGSGFDRKSLDIAIRG